jgi:succinoglycan biosynthesis transport protein ExoP
LNTFTDVGEGGRPWPLPLPRAAGDQPHSVAIPSAPSGERITIDLRQISSVLRRRWRSFAVAAVIIMAADAAITILPAPQYTATAEVMLNRRNTKITNNDNVLSALPADSQAVDTEVQILKSPQLSHRVVASLRLDQDPEFNPNATARASAPLSGKPLEQVVERVRRHLSVSRSGPTYVIDIAFRSQTPAKAAKIANAFANLYVAQQVGEKVNATQQAADWLNGRLQQLRAQVGADETAVEQFKIANNLMSSQGATLTEQELSNYNQSLAQANAQLAEDNARLSTARKQLATGSTGDDVGEALNSPTIQKLKEQRAEVSRKVASLASNYKDAYPALRTARQELADIDANIQAETRLIISNLEAKAQVSARRAASIGASVGSAKGELASNDRASVRLSELERIAQASRTLYENYLTRYKETSSQIGLAQADSQVVSQAAPPAKPSSPNVPLNLLAGAILALAAGIGAVGLAEWLEAGLATSADVEKRFNLRYLGAIPALHSVARHAKLSPIDYLVEKPFSGFGEAFRSLVASILHGASAGVVKTVVVTSALPGEGKTTTAICLARAASLQGYRVVIVDCDLRRRSLDRIAAEPAKVGLLEVLLGQVDLAEALVKDARTNVDILPLSQSATTLKDIFGSPDVARLLLQLRNQYDLVVLDTAPVVPVADSRILAQKADFVAVVARWRTTPYKAIQGALRLLADNGVEVGGLILNQVDMMQQARHGYGDMAYYFNAYRSYYLESADRAHA